MGRLISAKYIGESTQLLFPCNQTLPLKQVTLLKEHYFASFIVERDNFEETG